MYSSAVFTWGRPLCNQILPGQPRALVSILGTRKIDTCMGLPDGEDRIPLRSLILTLIPECDGQTDGRSI